MNYSEYNSEQFKKFESELEEILQERAAVKTEV